MMAPRKAIPCYHKKCPARLYKTAEKGIPQKISQNPKLPLDKPSRLLYNKVVHARVAKLADAHV